MFYTSVQGAYFYQVIFSTEFKFSEKQSTLRFHYSILSAINTTEIKALYICHSHVAIHTSKATIFKKVLQIKKLNDHAEKPFAGHMVFQHAQSVI